MGRRPVPVSVFRRIRNSCSPDPVTPSSEFIGYVDGQTGLLLGI